MHPLAAPGTLWVLSRVGKYLVRPQADETSHKKQIPCGRQETGLTFFSRITKDFASAEATRGLSDRPLGPLRGPSLYAWAKPPTLETFGPFAQGMAQRNKLLAAGRKRVYLSFPYHKGFRLCGGDQRAFRSPFGNLRALCSKGVAQKTDSLWKAREKLFLAFSCLAGDFAPAGATRGLSARPLDPFGNASIGEIQKYLTAHTRVRYFCIFPLFLPPDGRTVPAENVILPPHQGHESLSLR